MTLAGHLTIEAASAAELEAALTAGRLHVEITEVLAGVPGELLTHHLRPLLIEALTRIAAGVPRDEGTGPLVRVHIQRPAEENA